MDKKLSNDKINEIVQEYVDIYKNKEMKFDKINVLLPTFLFDMVNEGFDSVEQVRMSNGIFITLIINDYYKYIQELYNVDPLLYKDERLKYVRKQVHVTISPQTMVTIEEIKSLIGTSDRVGVVKNAIEHYVRTKSGDTNDIVLKKDILLDDD